MNTPLNGNSGSQEPPKIEFPCKNYPIKVMGDASEAFKAFVLDVMDRLSPEFDRERISVRDSSKGRFISVTVYITATGVAQLEEIHQTLRANPATKMVL